jgi:plastocyanin
MQRRTTTRALALGAAILLALGLAACGDDDDATGTVDDTTEATTDDTDAMDDMTDDTDATDDMAGEEVAGGTVVVQDFAFTVPAGVTPGSTITVDNQDSVPHTVTADDGAFDSARVAGGTEGSVTAPAEAGTYAFHCEVHPNMTGTLTVA